MSANTDNILRQFLMPVDIDGDHTQAIQLMKCVASMLDQRIEKITLLHVTGGKYLSEHMVNIDVRAGYLITSEKFKELRKPYIENKVKPALEKISEELKAAGLTAPIEIMVLDGEPVDQIVKTVNQGNYSSLVLQRSDKSSVAQIFLGSVAAGILHRDVHATIYLSPAPGTESMNCPPRCCMVALDGSKNSWEALKRAQVLALACGESVKKVVLATVLDTAKFSEELSSGSELSVNASCVEEAASQLEKAGVPVEKIVQAVRCGETAEVLAGLVEENSVDVIFMGRRERSALQELFMGSVSSRIIEKCPRQSIVLVMAD